MSATVSRSTDPCEPLLVCDEGSDACVGCVVDADCDNGLFCDGTETCDAGTCSAGTPPLVDDGVACTDDSCDEATDAVVNTPNATLCDNGAFCDGSEICDALLGCEAGTPPTLDDGVVCTDDSCDEATDSIVNAANDANCDNGLYCDGSETCDAALDCQTGALPSVDDSVACTDDSCDEVTDSAVNTPNDGLCDDGDACTADSCDGVTGCANDPIIGCTTGFTAYNDCVYDPGLDSTGIDPQGVSVHYTDTNVTTIGIGVVSGDSATYTGGSAYPNTSGELLDHATGNPTGITATFSENSATNVQWQPQVASTWTGGYDTAVGTDAHDTFGGIADMTGTTYYGAAGWWVDLTLTGLDPAATYTFATSATRSQANTTSTAGYTDRTSVYTLSGVDASTNVSTSGVTEVTPTSVSFVTGNNHAEGYVARWTDIDPGADGTIVIRVEADSGAPDGRKAYTFDVFQLVETGQATCGNGILEAGETCDDSNNLDGDCCSSSCQFNSVGAACDDADACTDSDTCDGAGTCLVGGPLDCDDANGCTDDSCDSGLGCQYADNTDLCDDANACTLGDICGGGSCQAGGPLDCNDANGCTNDSCDSGLGCQYVDNADPCDDGDACTDGDTCGSGSCQSGGPLDCDDTNGCTNDSCDSGLGCQYADNTNPCDNGDACTTGDACGGGSCLAGGPTDCDDADECTADSCDQVIGCAHDPIPLCGTSIPSASAGGRMLVGLLLMSAGAAFLVHRRRIGS